MKSLRGLTALFATLMKLNLPTAYAALHPELMLYLD